MRLRVKIEKENTVPGTRDGGPDIGASGGLANSALLVDDRDYLHKVEDSEFACKFL
jgi:hypothetical protein